LKKQFPKQKRDKEDNMKKRIQISLIVLIFMFVFISCGKQPEYKHQTIKKIDTGINPNGWVLIPKGDFYYGQFPKTKESINYDYEIMITDVTNKMYADYLNKALEEGKVKVKNGKVTGYYEGEKYYGFRHELKIPEGDDYPYFLLDEPGVRIRFDNNKFIVDSGFENHPVTLVTWFGANGYCKYYGWELPTEKEWEKAARGDEDQRAYPWGDDINEEYANYNFNNKLIRKKVFSINFQTTTPVGFFNGEEYTGFKTKKAISPYGLYDMAGNVWQWTRDRYPRMSDRFLKGGSFRNYDIDLRIWARNSAQPVFGGINIGFRCIRKPLKKIENNDIKKTGDKN
jgi:formylglycine-generating enzyme required for sulfatase activity